MKTKKKTWTTKEVLDILSKVSDQINDEREKAKAIMNGSDIHINASRLAEIGQAAGNIVLDLVREGLGEKT